jgi:citrate lyase subunit beta/citryl-CoA lyase
MDIEAVMSSPYRTVMLAKASDADQVRGLESFEVIALCETPRGIAQARAMAQCPNTIALMWGSEDLVAALGGSASRFENGTLRDVARYARAQVLLAAGEYDVGALDAVYIDFTDLEGQRGEAADAAAMGFMATPCIHPSQVPVIRDAYRPSASRLQWAQEVVALAQRHGGAFRMGGQMVDGPVLAQARQLLLRNGEGLP